MNGTESSESHDTTGSDHPVNNGENSSGNDEENNSGDRGENGLGTPVTEEDAGDKGNFCQIWGSRVECPPRTIAELVRR